MSPPAATQPATGGKAPTKEPGIMASEKTFFKGVYTALYQKNVRSPMLSVSTFDFNNNVTHPNDKKNNEIIKTDFEETAPEGIGRFMVLSISLSVLLS